MTTENRTPYYCFRKAVRERGYTMEQIKNWTYAGGFWGLGQHACAEINSPEDSRLRRKWVEVMGDDIEIPDDEIIEECICEVHIKWAHIIVDDPQAVNPEVLIIGSECVKCYSNDGDGLKTYKHCSECNEKHRNKDDKCSECKKKRPCERDNCSNTISKGKRQFCDSCREEKTKKKSFCSKITCYQRLRKGRQDGFSPLCSRCMYALIKRKDRTMTREKFASLP